MEPLGKCRILGVMNRNRYTTDSPWDVISGSPCSSRVEIAGFPCETATVLHALAGNICCLTGECG